MDSGGIGAGVDGERTGARLLILLAAPLNAEVLDRLAQGPRRLVELRHETGAPQTTLRAHLKELIQVGAVAKRRLHPFPAVREYVLTNRAGTELRFVAGTLEAWLAGAPRGPFALGGYSARAAVKALVDGWSSTLVHKLAGGPAAFAELDAAIESLSRSALERRLAALTAAGLVRPDGGGGSRYEATEWLRRAIAPLGAAARWERKHLPAATAPIGPIDAEASFLLAMSLIDLPAELSGTCRLGVEFADGAERQLVGATVEVAAGRVAACTTRLEPSPAAWATGPPSTWLRVAIEADPNRLDLGGDKRLARAVLDGLNRALFLPFAHARSPSGASRR